MLFNSLTFAIFLPLVFLLYWYGLRHSRKGQNCFLIIASYVFYGWWDWRFLGLIFLSSLTDFAIGWQLDRTSRPGARKWWLWGSIVVNLGLLGFFKYYDFFAHSLMRSLEVIGMEVSFTTLNLVLPVGISFYTFQTLSYTIDVYRKKMPATRDPIAFFAFVSFFPQLVAGPIERAIHLLPQFQRDRSFDLAKAKDGMRQMLWGFFKKLVVADNCGLLSDRIYGYGEYGDVSGFTLFLAGVLFAFQVYGDFAGYSDIAIGTARLFGFELMRNFAYPFFSRDIAELWRRWHISLTTWFKDYLYIPLGGSRGGLNMKIRNALIVFTVSGFWHGADWTYVAWGALHGLFFVPLLLANRNRNHLDIVARGRLLPTWRECWQMFATFWLFCVALIVFRSASIPHAIDHLSHMVTNAFWAPVEILNTNNLTILGIMIVLLVAEWTQRTREHTLEIAHLSTGWRWFIYAVVLIAIIYFGQYGDVRQFIYFQF